MHNALAAPSLAYVPLRLTQAPAAMKGMAILLGTLLLAASSWVEVPMVPVPMTMQTYAVVLVGALCGWRMGGLIVLAWLGEALIGLPVLAGGTGGPMRFAGPTGGYLIGFLAAAALVGWLAERGWTGGNLVRSFTAMLLGHAVALALGVCWLATLIGWEKAVAAGFVPFIAGTLVKSAFAVATVEAARRTRRAG